METGFVLRIKEVVHREREKTTRDENSTERLITMMKEAYKDEYIIGSLNE